MPAKLRDLRGRRFGDLVANLVVGRASNGGVIWSCTCLHCGGSSDVASGDLLRRKPDQILSCGCRRFEGGQKNRTHGMTDTPEYRVWAQMLDRCSNPKCVNYKNYGGRGISVCVEWQSSFEAFFAHVGPRPSAKHQIDRTDNAGNYEPGNVRWATAKVQANNRRSTKLITFDGRTKSLQGWAEELGITKQALSFRIKKWGLKSALSTKGRTDDARSKSHSRFNLS
jgi:hypothetical protein